MRIALVLRDMETSGGAEIAARTLARVLSSEHEVTVFQSPLRYFQNGVIPTEGRKLALCASGIALRERVLGDIQEFDPALIISQHEGALVGAALDIPHIIFLHDLHFCGRRYLRRLRRQASLTPAVVGSKGILRRLADRITFALGQVANASLAPVNRTWARYLLRSADLVVANSRYTASRHQLLGVDTEVVYPFIELDKYRCDGNGDLILHVNPAYTKGIDITLEVARQLPDREFGLVGGEPPQSIRSKVDELDNVVLLGRFDDMREVYQLAHLVIVPSRVESFGRVPVEAGSSGIPAIVGPTGGLPETVPSREFVARSNSPEAFVERIFEIDRDYSKYSHEVREYVSSLSAESQYERFRGIVRDRLELEL